MGDFDQDLKINDYAPLVIDNLGTRGGIVVINSTDLSLISLETHFWALNFAPYAI